MTQILTVLVQVLTSIAIIVIAMTAVASVLIVGRDRLAFLVATFPTRIRTTAPLFGILIVVLIITNVTRGLVPEISWIIGVNITGSIHAIEGAFIARLQSIATPWLTAYFSFMYVYGYVFLLVFPFIAYTALDELVRFKELIVAYIANYLIGLVSYIVFIAYGPRNLMPDLVSPLLYTTYPRFQLLTTQINTNTNVFPSLHTSLAITVALLAYQTRTIYPWWFPVASLFAVSISISTMYLGIHWATDVVAGVLLAVISVSIANYAVSSEWTLDRFDFFPVGK